MVVVTANIRVVIVMDVGWLYSFVFLIGGGGGYSGHGGVIVGVVND